MDNETRTYLDEIIRLLKITAQNSGSTPDDSYQFPKPTETTFQLEAGATYSRTLYPKRKLARLTIFAPSDVVIMIYKDGAEWRRYKGTMTYDDGVNGEYFNQFDLVAQNSGSTACEWYVIATFI